MKTKVKPYRGTLSAQQIVDGMNAAIRNARRLAYDAKTMLESSRYPTAVALAILSIEEIGKVRFLRLIAIASNTEQLKVGWNAYVDHKSKNASWILPDMIAQGVRGLDTLGPLLDRKSEHAELLDQFKQIALYSDCVGNARWSEPEKRVGKEIASLAVKHADSKRKNPVTLTEIEIWIKHMKPVYSSRTKYAVEEAAVNCLKEMKESGIQEYSDISTEDFAKLLGIEDT